MKRTKKIWQRLLAMALVLMMVLSYMPADVVAEGTPAVAEAKVDTLVKAVLTATLNEPETSEPEGEETPEGEGEPEGEEKPATYTYNVQVTALGEDVTENAAITTVIDGSYIDGCENYAVGADKEFAVTVSYKGVSFSLNSKDAQANGSTGGSVTVSYTTAYDLTKGQRYDVNKYQPVIAVNNATAEGKWTFVETEKYADYVIDGAVAVQENNVTFGTYQYAIGENEPLAQIAVVHNVFAPTYGVSLSGAEASVWYGEQKQVTVTAVANVALAVMPDNLPAVTAEGATIGEWTTDDYATFTKTVTVSETTTITAGSESLTVQIDKEVPAISKVDSYETKDGTVVEFDVVVGESGIAEVKINNTAYSYTAPANHVAVTVPEKLGANFAVAVTSNAGLTGVAGDNDAPLELISVQIAVPETVIGIENDITYISAADVFTITVSNSHGVFTPVVTDQGDVPVEVTWNGNVGTFSLAVGGTLNGLKVKVTDDKNRTAEDAVVAVYKVDNTAPNIAFSGLKTNVLTYVQLDQEYRVTITEDAILGDNYEASYTYTENGEVFAKKMPLAKSGQKAEGFIKLTHGQNLTKIEASATNATGLSAADSFETNVIVDTKDPVITADISAVDGKGKDVAVVGFHKNGDNYFVHLDPVETNDTDGTVTVTMTFTLVEDYPDTVALESDGWTCNEGTWTKVVSWEVKEDTTGRTEVSATAKDLSERVPTASIIIMGEDTNRWEMLLNAESGTYTTNVCVDRRTPSTGVVTDVPEVVLTPVVATTLTTADGTPLYNNDFNFTINVTDASKYDSGVKEVTWQVLEENGAEFLNNEKYTEKGAGEYTISVTSEEAGECNDVTLVVTVTDNVGNTYTKTEVFAFDNLAPQVSVSYEDKGTVKNENFFNAPRTATVTYKDRNLSVAQYMEDALPEADCTIEDGKATATVTFAADGHHTLSTYAADLAQNDNTLFDCDAVAPYDFYVDTTPPVIVVDQSNTEFSSIVENIEYYDAEVIFTITASDTYMGTAYEGAEAWVKYTKVLVSGETEEENIDLLKADDRKTVISLGEGETLTDLQVYACDNAGWTTDLHTNRTEGFEAGEVSGVYQLNRDIAVDMKPATVSVKKTGELVQTVDGVDYYNNVVTYKLTISDHFPMEENVAEVEIHVNYNTDEKDLILQLRDLEYVENSEYTYTTEFPVEDGDDVSAMTIVVKDNAGNITKTIDVNEDVLTSFAYKKDMNVYTGNHVVVDMTVPEASMKFSENVKSVYTNGGTVYVVLDKPATGDSGIFAGQQAETVTATITAKDKNIALHETSVKTNEGKGKWTGKKVDVNTDRALTYTQSITVKADKTGAFAFDLNVRDLAGNALKELVFEPINNTTVNLAVEKDGSFGTTVSVDRRRPSSVDDDTAAPVITVNPGLVPTTSSNGLELFSNAFDFDLTVTDGQAGTLNSGIKTVDWVIEDAVGFVVASNVTKGQLAGTYTERFTIPVAVNGVGETNAAKLTITAVDNVGNTTTYVKEFAVDNQAPRIVVNYDNNSAQNGKYFKANRTATIQATDINFNAQTSEITTQVAPTSWVQNGDTWTSTCSYTEDGEYTFAVRSVDLANNAAEDSSVDYEGEVAPKDFVIDKTAPVITVTYDPSASVGKDDHGVSYYDQELDVTVNIREVNFNAADVRANFNSDNALGGFSGGSDNHSAYETFTEGNEYHFTIDYTDMAGNPANTYESTTFSVDLTDPTIAITSGNMTEKNLNIVQDNLVLEFTVNDEQSNLEAYEVKVTRLNNEFKEETVSGSDYYTISSADERTRVVVDFENILKDKGNDGIYTVEISAKDYAGRKDDMTVLFSLNRFGSTFTTDDPFTQSFLTPSADGAVYKNMVGEKLIFKEINPNKVWSDSAKSAEGSVLTVAVNGTTTVLKEGVDYTMSVAQEGAGNSKWYVYTYEVDPSIFMQGDSLTDGRYSLLIYGEDEAGNKNTNESNAFGGIQLDANGEYSGKIEFTLDATAPIISTTGIETGGSYNTENQYMKIFLSDNTPMGIAVHLNGQMVQMLDAAGAANVAWLIWDDAEGCYVLNVPEMNTLFGRQSVEIQVTDAAGNSAESVVDEFTVSSNLFVRFTNSVWFWIVCGALLLLILLMIIFLKKKKRVAV